MSSFHARRQPVNCNPEPFATFERISARIATRGRAIVPVQEKRVKILLRVRYCETAGGYYADCYDLDDVCIATTRVVGDPRTAERLALDKLTALGCARQSVFIDRGR
jgi:hypothetical protein